MSAESRGGSISKIAGDPHQLAALRQHLEEITRGGVFGGSPRSQQFLRYVVERSVEGDFDSLKERMIGVNLFRRSPSYDTGEDAVVRVTASDVRRRLQQHYGRYGGVRFRIEIPPGSYIPEITDMMDGEPPVPVILEPVLAPESHVSDKAVSIPESVVRPAGFTLSRTLLWFIFLATIVAMAAAFWAGVRFRRQPVDLALLSASPWSGLFETGRVLQIVPSDPDFATLQDIAGHSISLADYANERYVPDSPVLSPEMRTFSLKYLRGARAADIDLPIVADIVSLANSHASKYAIRPARLVRMADFETDDDFVLLGSAIANPWIDLFRDRLDFRFQFTNGSSLEQIENVRPFQDEPKFYSPVAGRFESKPPTGATFAIVAYLQNPHHRGHVLILAGVGAEGTAAAAHLALSSPELTNAVHKCQPTQSGSLRDFELLLRVNVMAGSAINTDVLACHAIT